LRTVFLHFLGMQNRSNFHASTDAIKSIWTYFLAWGC
jgi:hypothetical protein